MVGCANLLWQQYAGIGEMKVTLQAQLIAALQSKGATKEPSLMRHEVLRLNGMTFYVGKSGGLRASWKGTLSTAVSMTGTREYWDLIRLVERAE